MTDPDTFAPLDTSVSRAAFDATLSVYDALNVGLRAANKAALFAALAAAGISHVIVSFDGYGDEGQIENVEARAGDDPADLPDTSVPVSTAEWAKPDPVVRDLPVAELIERLAYNYLADAHPGWENGDGACGEFVFDVAAGTITLDHNDRYTAIENFTHTF